MKNEYGLDVDYFRERLERVLRDINRYTPEELARELARCASAADSKVLAEPEFSNTTTIKYNSRPITINI